MVDDKLKTQDEKREELRRDLLDELVEANAEEMIHKPQNALHKKPSMKLKFLQNPNKKPRKEDHIPDYMPVNTGNEKKNKYHGKN
jgi:hypothetical protein